MTAAPRLAVPAASPPPADEAEAPELSQDVRRPIGQLLLEAGLIGREDLEKALAFQ